MRYGIDISNYQTVPSQADLSRWHADGINHIVIRASQEANQKIEHAVAQAHAVKKDERFTFDFYTWAYFTEDPDSWASGAVDLFGYLAPGRYWVDCEETGHVGFPAHNVQWLHRYLAALKRRGVATGIYTGEWWWGPYMGNSSEFTDQPLWTALYDGRPDLTIWNHYGGWAFLSGKQYGSNPIDLNVFDDALFSGVAEDPAMIAELISTLGYLQGDVADAMQEALDSARKARSDAKRKEALDSIEAAINTLRTEGK